VILHRHQHHSHGVFANPVNADVRSIARHATGGVGTGQVGNLGVQELEMVSLYAHGGGCTYRLGVLRHGQSWYEQVGKGSV
jgi:hypothetical protein